MFQMTEKEFTDWKSQIEISKSDKMGLRKAPLVFTEQGVAMLSSVLNSDRAISVNIQIIRAFSRMRQMLESHKEIIRKLEDRKPGRIPPLHPNTRISIRISPNLQIVL